MHLESKTASESHLCGANRRIDELESALKLDKAQVAHILGRYNDLKATTERDSSSSAQASAQATDLSNSVAGLTATCEALRNNVAKGDADYKDPQTKMEFTHQGHVRNVAVAVARVSTLEAELLLAQAPRDSSGSALHFCLECSDKQAQVLLLQSECERLRDEVRLRENRIESDRKGHEGALQLRDHDKRELSDQFRRENEELRTKRFLTSLMS